MKRIRNEHIQSALSQYLKRRHYSESEVKKEYKALVPVEKVALQWVVGGEGSMSNVVSYSSISGDVTACDQQYNRLHNFITDAVDPYRAELEQLLCPVFIHVYLELLSNGHTTPAHKFYNRHHGAFKEIEEYVATIEALRQMYSPDDIRAHKQVQDFRDHKFSVSVSDDSLQYLFRYLRNGDNVLMLQIINHHIHMKVKAVEEGDQSDSQGESQSQEAAAMSPPFTPENKVIRNEMSLGSLQQVIRKVREGPPCLGSLCFYTFLNTYQGLCSCNISRDNQLMCAGFEDSSIRLWSLGTKKLSPSAPTVSISHINMAGDFEKDIEEKLRPPDPCETATLRGHSGSVYSAKLVFDNQYILSASEDTSVRLWSLDTHSNVVLYEGHNYPVWDVDASPVSSNFATVSHDKTAKLWCTDRVYPLRTYIGHNSDVNCIQFHPNSSYMATGGADRSVRLWSIQEGKAVRLFHGHRAGVLALAFSPNGQYLASSGEDRRVKVWDLSAGTLLKDLRGHTDTVYSLSFSKDSSLLASGGLDCVIRVWDVRKATSTNSVNESVSASDLLGAFPTKSNVVHYLQYTWHSRLLAAGAFGC